MAADIAAMSSPRSPDHLAPARGFGQINTGFDNIAHNPQRGNSQRIRARRMYSPITNLPIQGRTVLVKENLGGSQSAFSSWACCSQPAGEDPSADFALFLHNLTLSPVKNVSLKLPKLLDQTVTYKSRSRQATSQHFGNKNKDKNIAACSMTPIFVATPPNYHVHFIKFSRL
ncbi:hypothetical protein XELAEV_18026552mg [Xenopus laevis]|uniref:Uncharacterized protein n=1 Tax=Xenopus laevis TaxID=8355 RepID=A0A974HIV5_XENLA|nr:hypothetical protein XELAEV_18026552mg [Xenopus laevis]